MIVNPRREELKEQTPGSLVLISVMTLGAAVLVPTALIEVGKSDYKSMIAFMLFALILAGISSRHPLKLPNTHTSVSMSEIILFLAVMHLGPYHACLLAALDMFIVCRRLQVKFPNNLFNISNFTIATFIAGKTCYAVKAYILAHEMTESVGKVGQDALKFSLPLVALAATHFLHIPIVALMVRIKHGSRIRDTLRQTFAIEAATFMAAATIAGIVIWVRDEYGLVATAIAMMLFAPILIMIFYTYRTYQDRLQEQQEHYHELNEINDSILQMLAMAIDAKDQTTHEHIQRVRLFAARVGQIVQLSDAEIEALKAGALLHDIGKIGIPAYILNKPGKLTEHEFEQMKMHTIIGADMLSSINFRYPVVPIVRHHHERWDGKGYPDGLKRDEIPMTARILTLVDNYDALRSDRPYHRAMTQEETLEYIKQNAGTFFDPSLVNIFLSVVDDLENEAREMLASQVKDFSMGDRSASQKNGGGGLKSAGPAAGFASPLQIDRATAALNSIAETNQRVAALYEMSRTLASSLSLEDTVAILANRLSKIVPFTTCAISLFDPSRSEFEFVHTVGRDAEKFMRRRFPVSAGITGWVIQHQRPMYNTNPVLDLGFLGHEIAVEYRTAMVFPLVKNREPLGAIGLYSTEIESYPSEYVLIMEAITQPASDSLYNALAFERAQRAVLNDAVTGLPNMRAFAAQFEREQLRSRRLGTPLSLAVVRLNNLTAAVVRAGISNDQLLVGVAEVITKEVRDTDVVARHSSDTFVVLLPESGLLEAADVLERIGEAMRRDNRLSLLSVSLGSATTPDHGNNFEDMLRVATLHCDATGQERLAVESIDFLH